MRTRTHLATTRDHSQTIKRRHHAWRGTCYVALHPLRGAAPVTWRCTRTERVQCPRIGCNAHGSGVPRSQIRTCVEPGIPQRERRRPKRPYTQTRTRPQAAASRVVLRPLRGAAPVAWRYTRYVALHPNRTGAMPTDRVYRAPTQERPRNLESHNTKEGGLNTPAQNPGLGNPSGLSTYGWVNDSSSRAQPCRRGRKERGTRVGQPL